MGYPLVENLFKKPGGMMWAVLGKLADKLPVELAEDLNRDPKIIEVMIKAASDYHAMKLKNPFEMTVGEQIQALRLANDEEKWGLTEDVFSRLAETAPAWPKGELACRSLRVRFGEGDEGVERTFEAHCARIQHVCVKEGFSRCRSLCSGKVKYQGKIVECLRLLNGNHTHHACVEWVVADLDTFRNRRSVKAVRDANSLADELLVIAWMFPDMIRAIDHNKLPGLFAAGYEVNCPLVDDPENNALVWQDVACVDFDQGDCQVVISTSDLYTESSLFSVPSLLELPVLGA